MNTSVTPRQDRGGSLALLGATVAIVGVVAFAFDQLSVDFASWLGGSGWTLFIILPGLALLAAALVLQRGAAQATTVAGAVVTTVGLLLLYQDQNAHYESWAYAWALIPGAAGVALTINGLRFERPDLVSIGTRMVAVFGALFVAGLWYFETIFRTDEAPFDLGKNWPIALILLGGVLLVLGLIRGSAARDSDGPA
jgi:hypothetical protein